MKLLNKLRLSLSNKLTNCSTKIMLLDRYFSKDEAQSKVFKVSAATTTAILCGVSPSVRADGIAGMASKGAEQASSIQESAAIFFYCVGFICVGYGIYNIYRKGKEGEQSNVTGTKILLPMLAGAGLAAVAFILDKSAETVDIDTTGYGTVK